MIRFRNPISNMGILIENFKKMYVEFSNMDYFDLDNIAEFFAREQLASSSGYIGDEALKRSYQIKDDSRKSMKMQAKSYSELFRFLGWITSRDKALNFNFTYLGLHVALSGEGAKSLFEQCLLGIEYPNHILNVKFSDINKPFVNMLVFAKRLDGIINRDEILLGPMNLSNGYSSEEIEKKIAYLKKIRESKKLSVLDGEIQKLADLNEMQTVSVRNLTRFVISALEYSGWFEKKNLKVYGKSSPFLVLTEKGQDTVLKIEASYNFKGEDINLDSETSLELVDTSLLCMLKRANFDVDEALLSHEDILLNVEEMYGKKDLLFSPYQYFSGEELDKALPQYQMAEGTEHRDTEITSDISIHSYKSEIIVESKKTELTQNDITNKKLQKRIKDSKGSIEKAVQSFLSEVSIMKQSDFYPLIADLLGFVFNRDAFAPSAGNNMRYDVMIPDEKYSIPVEVKSPTEEEMLSVKAIRQALENKVLLLARKPFPTVYEVSSIACGYKLPNDRSDVYKLIEEIYQVYGINISILDVETLIRAAFYCAKTESYYKIDSFNNKKGVIKFENF